MLIEVKNVTSGYKRDVMILKDVSIRAEESKITCVIGPNGAGKSTLMKTIYGYLKPERGKIFLGGEDVTKEEPETMSLRGLGYIPQTSTIFPYLTVRENLEMGLWNFRKDKKKVRDSIDEMYEKYPILRERENVLASRLSGGEQKMLEFARTLATDPKTILLDEPTAGLAPIPAKEIYREIEKLAKQDITILAVDQNVRKIVSLSHYVYVMKTGQIETEGSKKEFNRELKSLISDWLV